MPPIYASTLHRRDRAWGRRRAAERARMRAVVVLTALLAAGAGALIERLLG
jgi:hypothetical protein